MRTVLVLGGLLAGLTAAEGLLRAGGLAYKTWRLRGHAPSAGAGVILCAGDSYTFGVGAPRGYGYPERLQLLIDDGCGEGRYTVVNEGIPGQNSTQTRRRLPALVERHRPRGLVVLTGVNNITLLESDFALFDPKTSTRHSRVLVWLNLQVRSLRLYKLIRLVSRVERAGGDQRPADARKDCAPAAERLLAEGNAAYGAGDFTLAEASARKAARAQGACAQAHYQLAFILYKRGKYEEAFSRARLAQRLNPEHPDVRWLLSKEIPLTRPEEVQPVLTQLLGYDLSRIAVVARDHEIALVLQNYPWADNDRDGVRRSVARSYGAAFVDNERRFQSLPAGRSPREYRAFDEPGGGHPNAAGYELMAQGVYVALKNVKVISCPP